jgi:hypothetical protein
VDNVRPRRFAVVDRERGLVFGLFMFHVSGTVTSYTPPGRETMPALPQNLSPYTIAVAELYKIKNAQIGRIEAMQVNVPYGTPARSGPPSGGRRKRPVPVLTPSPAKPGPAIARASRASSRATSTRWWRTIPRACRWRRASSSPRTTCRCGSARRCGGRRAASGATG